MINYLRGAVKRFEDKFNTVSPEVIWFALVILIAAAVRGISWANTPMITNDGVVYIGQAKAIFYGQWEVIAECHGFKLLSLYPFLIAGLFSIVQDWVFAGKAVNFAFSLASIVFLYLLLRQFFDYKISALAAIIVGVSPFFVSASVNVLRDPGYWFFSLLGLYLFTVFIKDNNRLFLLLSSFFFLLATWQRIEASLFFVVSFCYLLCKYRDIRKSLIFLSPAIIVFIIVLLGAYFKDASVDELHRVDDLFHKLLGSFSGYFTVRSELKELAKGIDGTTHFALKYFLPEARMNMWLIAFGTLINKVLEALLYLFFIPSVIGLARVKKIKEDPRLIYFMLLVASSFVALYLSIFQHWVLQSRYVALFILPSIVFAGVGLEAIVSWCGVRLKLKEPLFVFILACVMVFSALPKNIQDQHPGKNVFKEIGEYLVKKESGNQQEIIVSASIATQRYVSFYANLNYEGAMCHEANAQTSWELLTNYDSSFIRQLKERNIKYLLWTEKTWSNNNVNINKYRKYLKELSKWKSSFTGQMILFEVM